MEQFYNEQLKPLQTAGSRPMSPDTVMIPDPDARLARPHSCRAAADAAA